MSELLELCAVITVIYLLDCALVVPLRAIGLVRFAGRWRAQRVFSPNASWSQGALFGNPLPPLSPAFIAEPLPLLLGPDGLSVQASGGDPEFTRWDELGPVAAIGPRLMVGHRELALLATRRGAGVLADCIREAVTLGAAARTERLEQLIDARFDVRAVNSRLEIFQREVRLLSFVTNLLWVALVLSLVALVRLPLVVVLMPMLGLLLAGWITAALLVEWKLRRSVWLRPAWRPEPSKRALAALTPIGAIRSVDLLARELFGDMDPLAVASVLLPQPGFVALARARLVELRFGGRSEPAGGERDRAWWRAALRRRVEDLLRAQGVDVEKLVVAPPRDGQDIVSWCPSCLDQYGDGYLGSGCNNTRCAGIALVPYEAAADRRRPD